MSGFSLTFLWQLLEEDALAPGQSNMSSSSLCCEGTALTISLAYWSAHEGLSNGSPQVCLPADVCSPVLPQRALINEPVSTSGQDWV